MTIQLIICKAISSKKYISALCYSCSAFQPNCQYSYHRSKSHGEAIDSSQAEVGQFDTSICSDEYVLRFQIPMHNAMGVYKIDAFQYLTKYILQNISTTDNFKRFSNTAYRYIHMVGLKHVICF